MCSKKKQPAPPINTPAYALGSAAPNAFDLSMRDESGKETDLDGRTTQENRRASGHKE